MKMELLLAVKYQFHQREQTVEDVGAVSDEGKGILHAFNSTKNWTAQLRRQTRAQQFVTKWA
jgi:hypothetical protein